MLILALLIGLLVVARGVMSAFALLRSLPRSNEDWVWF